MLQDKAMLATLSISRWSARKIDKKVTREVTRAHGATDDSGEFRKTLIDRAHLKPLMSSESAIRAYHYKMTLPWGEDNERILPAKSFQEYTDTNRQLRAADERLRRDFVALYPSLRTAAQSRLGSLYDPKDFPSPSEVADKFDIKISFKPVPAADDFRVDVGNEAAAQIRASINAENEEKFATAMKHCYGRIHEVVSHISETLHKEEPRIFDTLVTNARDLVDCLPALNLADDPKLEELRLELLSILPTPGSLRTSPTARKRTADAADAILAKMAAYK